METRPPTMQEEIKSQELPPIHNNENESKKDIESVEQKNSTIEPPTKGEIGAEVRSLKLGERLTLLGSATGNCVNLF